MLRGSCCRSLFQLPSSPQNHEEVCCPFTFTPSLASVSFVNHRERIQLMKMCHSDQSFCSDLQLCPLLWQTSFIFHSEKSVYFQQNMTSGFLGVRKKKNKKEEKKSLAEETLISWFYFTFCSGLGTISLDTRKKETKIIWIIKIGTGNRSSN